MTCDCAVQNDFLPRGYGHMKTDLPNSGEVQQVLAWSEQVGINRDAGVYHRDAGGYQQDPCWYCEF